jgi:hypothetical protein
MHMCENRTTNPFEIVPRRGDVRGSDRRDGSDWNTLYVYVVASL